MTSTLDPPFPFPKIPTSAPDTSIQLETPSSISTPPATLAPAFPFSVPVAQTPTTPLNPGSNNPPEPTPVAPPTDTDDPIISPAEPSATPTDITIPEDNSPPKEQTPPTSGHSKTVSHRSRSSSHASSSSVDTEFQTLPPHVASGSTSNIFTSISETSIVPSIDSTSAITGGSKAALHTIIGVSVAGGLAVICLVVAALVLRWKYKARRSDYFGTEGSV